MTDKDSCEVCIKTEAETLNASGYHGLCQNCPRCGKFKISGTVLSIMRGAIGDKVRAKLSGWIRDQNRAGTTPEINSSTYKNIISRPIPSVADRALRLLVEAAYGQTELGIRFNVRDPKFLAATYSHNENDLLFLMRFLLSKTLRKE